MSKQINAKELADIVTRLLTDTQATGELESLEAFEGFMTDIAKTVCNYCGGELREPAELVKDGWQVAIIGNDSLPDASGGIWREYDPTGDFFAADTPQRDEVLQTPMRTELENEVAKGATSLDYWDWVWAYSHAKSDAQANTAAPV